MASGRGRGFGFDLGTIQGVSPRNDVVTEMYRSDL
jgi:hypothetical protein